MVERIRTLQHALDSINDDIIEEFLSLTFPRVSLSKFSRKKTLFNFQQQALRNAIKALFVFYERNDGDKERFFQLYRDKGIELKGYLPKGHLHNYREDFLKHPGEKEIPFSQFCNRISFWMATGSGKTLVIVKLIEILAAVMKTGKLPQKDILFLAHRDEIIKQFKELVDEFNEFSTVKISLHDIKEFNKVKYLNPSLLKESVNVFYYRSDLISDERKDAIIDFGDYDNNGDWFILLDEAHKGSSKDISKRQTLYSIMSRKGFLFNFSATFTEERDSTTCVFNFNLDKFVKEGYGKQIYVSSKDAEGFKKNEDFSHLDKQKIVMKTLILHTYVAEYVAAAKQKTKQDLYHRPLLMSLVNSVNYSSKNLEEGKLPDLQLLFNELDDIANNKLKKGIFEKARRELTGELTGAEFSIGDGKIQMDPGYLARISYQDILLRIFNAKKPGNIEALRIPGSKQEIALQLHSSDQPFALIRIGDIAKWINNVLLGHKQVNRTWSGDSIFDKLNTLDSSINILMGSRTFYEGWDSNRPNIILFVNIGVGADSKKFVLQAIGRGVRVEPIADHRRRAHQLLQEGKIKKDLYKKIEPYKDAAETLFVFGTKADNLKKIIDYVKLEKQAGGAAARSLGNLFDVTLSDTIPVDKTELRVPQYKDSEKLLVEEKSVVRYPISAEDLAITRSFLNGLPDKVAIMMYECPPQVVDKVKSTFENEDKYYKTDQDTHTISRPIVTTDRIIEYFSSRSKEFNEFKPLTNEIIHYQKVSFTGSDEQYKQLKSKIEVMTNEPEQADAQLEEDYKKGKIDFKEFKKRVAAQEGADSFEAEGVKFDLWHLANHYYNPVLTSQSEKQEYLQNIVQVKSEVEFLKKLSAKVDELDESFEWWMFSKLNEHWDKISIPYYNTSRGAMGKYHPDFIFWLKEKGADMLHILFVDPKGTKHADYLHKAEYHAHLFGKPGEEKLLPEGDMNTKVYLRFFTGDIAEVGYNKDYWLDDVKAIAKLGKSPAKKQTD